MRSRYVKMFIPMVLTIWITIYGGCTKKDSASYLKDFENELSLLQSDLLHSIPKAIEYYKVNISKLPVEQRDSSFLLFTNYYYKVKYKLNDSLMFDLDLLNKLSDNSFKRDSVVRGFKELVKGSGFILSQSEGYFYVEEAPNFLTKNFAKYLSPAFSEYLNYRSRELSEGFADDAALVITFKKVAKRILTWNDYLKKYPHSYYSLQINNIQENYIDALLGKFDNAPIFDDRGKLKNEVKSTYKFLVGQKDSSELKDYFSFLYNKLEQSDFTKTNEIEDIINSRQQFYKDK
ncbi:MAG TPA: hypothetical protein PK559_08995 [Ignavibacteriaceae bacterium]|nr:hypothetical protein [Ignavibacteriaceae bacterium]